jgi:cytochrome P450
VHDGARLKGDDAMDDRPEPDWTPRARPLWEDYERLRGQCPVAWSDSFGGFWSLMKHADAAKAARDWATFRSQTPFVEFPDFAGVIPLSLNPPEHGPYRKLLNHYFRPHRMAALEPAVQGFVDEHLGELLAEGGGDAVVVLARPVPQRTLAALLNMPDDSWRMFVGKLAGLHALADDPDAANALLRDMWTDEVVALVRDREAHPRDPDTDLVSGVLAAEIDGRRLTFEECVAIGVQLFSAGGDTTTSSITTALYRLAADPEAQRRLREDPALIPTAVEEFLRVGPPLHHMARVTSEDVTVGGRTIPAGSRVTLNFASANHDPEVFPEPDRCVIDRNPNRHLTFGFGPHVCLGAPLARMELRLVLESVLARTSSIELDGPPVELHKVNLASGFASLPLLLA